MANWRSLPPVTFFSAWSEAVQFGPGFNLVLFTLVSSAAVFELSDTQFSVDGLVGISMQIAQIHLVSCLKAVFVIADCLIRSGQSLPARSQIVGDGVILIGVVFAR